MKCVLCKYGETKPGNVIVTLTRKDTVIIIKEVPADVCINCGEYYLSDTITEKVLLMEEKATQQGIEVEILRFVA